MFIIYKFLWSFLNDLNIDTATDTTLIMVFIFSILLLVLLFYIIKGEWLLFKKFNKPGFFAVIPFFDIISLINISGLSWYWFLIILFRFFYSVLDSYLKININFLIILSILISYFGYCAVSYNLMKKFHKDETWLFGAVFLTNLMWANLGYLKDNCDNNILVSKNSFLVKNKTKYKNIDNNGQF